MEKIEVLLKYINNEIEVLDPEDAEGHVWWGKFLELALLIQKEKEVLS